MPRSHRPKAISGVVRVDFGQEPGAARIGREQFHHWREVGFWLAGLVALLVQAAIAEQLFADICGQEFHGSLLSLEVFSKTRRNPDGRTSPGVTLRFCSFREGPRRGNPQTKESLD